MEEEEESQLEETILLHICRKFMKGGETVFTVEQFP